MGLTYKIQEAMELQREAEALRAGDQVWQIEEIGRVGAKVIHAGSYWVVDPYRKQSPEKGWLIHEQRTELTLP